MFQYISLSSHNNDKYIYHVGGQLSNRDFRKATILLHPKDYGSPLINIIFVSIAFLDTYFHALHIKYGILLALSHIAVFKVFYQVLTLS